MCQQHLGQPEAGTRYGWPQQPKTALLQGSFCTRQTLCRRTLARVHSADWCPLCCLQYWHETIAPVVKSGKNVIIAAHGNSLRALVSTAHSQHSSDTPCVTHGCLSCCGISGRTHCCTLQQLLRLLSKNARQQSWEAPDSDRQGLPQTHFLLKVAVLQALICSTTPLPREASSLPTLYRVRLAEHCFAPDSS